MRLHVFLLSALLVSNVTLRLFTNKLGFLPKAFNIADVFITLLLFLLSFRAAPVASEVRQRFRFGGRLTLFNLILVLGVVLNLKFFYAPAALSQIIMWNEPLLLFIAITRLPFTDSEIERFQRLLVRLLILEVVIGVFQVPISLKTGHTEEIIGTFYGNAEQYQGFIMLAVFYLLARQHIEPWIARKMWLMIGIILILVVLIDNKASWLGVLISLLVVLKLQYFTGWSRYLNIRYAFPLVLLLTLAGSIAVKVSPTISKLEGFVEACRSGQFTSLGKIKGYSDILQAFSTHWHMTLVGSGSGNFYSRAAGQFYLMPGTFIAPGSEYRRTFSVRVSNSMGGIINPTAAREPFYQPFYLDREITPIGSAQVDSPFSSYAALLGETGLVGFFCYLGIYCTAFLRVRRAAAEFRTDAPAMYPFALATLGFLAYVVTDSLYNHWLETGRMTTILWAMIALVLKYQPPACASVTDKSEAVDEAMLLPNGSAVAAVTASK